MNQQIRTFFTLTSLFLFLIIFPGKAETWRDRMDSMTYSPRYFGANAFPIPELYGGRLSDKYEIELRYDYHHSKGDITKDIFGRGYFPFGKKAALEIYGVINETYQTTEEVMNERWACNRNPKQADNPCAGDMVINALFELVRSDKWLDALFIFGLKTASGNMLCDARYTDAANYWFQFDLGRNLIQSDDQQNYLRMTAMVGFYCYMTNHKIHRQNDAWMAGAGLQGKYRDFSLNTDIRGFDGYWSKGDEPLLVQAKLKYTLKNHSIYFRYQEGLYDYYYQTYSGGYIFSF